MSDDVSSINRTAMLGKWFWVTFSGGGFELLADGQNLQFIGRLGGQGPEVQIELVLGEDGSWQTADDSCVQISLNAEQLLLKRRGKDGKCGGDTLACRTPQGATKVYFIRLASRLVPGGNRSASKSSKPSPRLTNGMVAYPSDPLPSACSMVAADAEAKRGRCASDPTMPYSTCTPRTCEDTSGRDSSSSLHPLTLAGSGREVFMESFENGFEPGNTIDFEFGEPVIGFHDSTPTKVTFSTFRQPRSDAHLDFSTPPAATNTGLDGHGFSDPVASRSWARQTTRMLAMQWAAQVSRAVSAEQGDTSASAEAPSLMRHAPGCGCWLCVDGVRRGN